MPRLIDTGLLWSRHLWVTSSMLTDWRGHLWWLVPCWQKASCPHSWVEGACTRGRETPWTRSPTSAGEPVLHKLIPLGVEKPYGPSPLEENTESSLTVIHLKCGSCCANPVSWPYNSAPLVCPWATADSETEGSAHFSPAQYIRAGQKWQHKVFTLMWFGGNSPTAWLVSRPQGQQ